VKFPQAGDEAQLSGSCQAVVNSALDATSSRLLPLSKLAGATVNHEDLKKLDGVKWTPKKLADGTVKIYYRDRKTGIPFGSDPAEVHLKWSQLRAATTKVNGRERVPGTLAAIIAAYGDSLEFLAMTDRTQELWRPFLAELEDRFGHAPPAAVTRKVVMTLKDTLLKDGKPAREKNRWTCWRRLWQWALDKGHTNIANPFSDPGPFYLVKTDARGKTRVTKDNPNARKSLWTVEDIDHFLKTTRRVRVGGHPIDPAKQRLDERSLPQHIKIAFLLGLFTLQRQADILSMNARQIVEREGKWWIGIEIAETFEQQKTKTELAFPLSEKVRLALESAGIRPGQDRLLVSTKSGGRLRRENFYREFNKWIEASGLDKKQLTFQALRRSGMVLLGQDNKEQDIIRSLSGHSQSSAGGILEKYLLKTPIAAAKAVEALDRITAPIVSTPAAKDRPPGDRPAGRRSTVRRPKSGR
jgi:hypothetical protein